MDIFSEANKLRSSFFIAYLGHWLRGRQPPEYVSVPSPNDPQNLPPRPQFVYPASATGHPRLVNPTIDKSNRRFNCLPAALLPTHRVENESLPFVLGVSHRTQLLPTSFLLPSNATEQLHRGRLPT